jgi:hypothetical protein
MAAKTEGHNVKLTGPGLTLERPISQEIAAQIFNLVMTGVATGATPPGTPPASGGTTGAAPTGAGAPANASGGPTPKQFIAQKQPENHCERVACLAYYLTHYRDAPKFKTPEIRQMATDAATKLSNPARDVANATSMYGYLVTAGGGRKQITTLGEAVVEALPDREKVKAAIEAHKPRRRKKRRKAKR